MAVNPTIPPENFLDEDEPSNPLARAPEPPVEPEPRAQGQEDATGQEAPAEPAPAQPEPLANPLAAPAPAQADSGESDPLFDLVPQQEEAGGTSLPPGQEHVDPAKAAEAEPVDYPDMANSRNFGVEDYRRLLRHPNVQRGLYAIRQAEGTQRYANPYTTAFGGRQIGDLSWHPMRAFPFRNPAGGPNATTAAGAYQFLGRTWNGVARRLGLRDFSPESQDIAALHLINQRGGLRALVNGDAVGWARAVRGEWASFPGAGYGQGEQRMSRIVRWFNSPGADAIPDYAEIARTGRFVSRPNPNSGAGAVAQVPGTDAGTSGGGASAAAPRSPRNPLADNPYDYSDRETGGGDYEPSTLRNPLAAAAPNYDPNVWDERDEPKDVGADPIPPSTLGQPQASRRPQNPLATNPAQAYAARLSGLRRNLFGG